MNRETDLRTGRELEITLTFEKRNPKTGRLEYCWAAPSWERRNVLKETWRPLWVSRDARTGRMASRRLAAPFTVPATFADEIDGGPGKLELLLDRGEDIALAGVVAVWAVSGLAMIALTVVSYL